MTMCIKRMITYIRKINVLTVPNTKTIDERKKKNGNGMFMSQICSCQLNLGYKPYSIMVRTLIADMNTRVGQHDTI